MWNRQDMRNLALFATIIFLTACGHNKKETIQWFGDRYIENHCDTSVIDASVTEWRDNHPQVLSFTWDDTTPGHKEVAKLLDKYGVKGTFFIVTTQVKSWKVKLVTLWRRKSSINYDDIYKSGHEIGSHTAHHCNMIHATLDSVNRECQLSSEQIYDLYGYFPATLSHPTSHYNHQIDSIVHLYYLDSRYSTKKDSDSSIVFMHVRTAYNFDYYKTQLDSFAISEKKQYIYGGHEMDGLGYEPINSSTLDSLLSYITAKYSEQFWITTFGNLAMYKYMYDNVTIDNEPGRTIIRTNKIANALSKYTRSESVITLCYPNNNLDVYSPGLVNYWYENGNTYVSIDVRRGCTVYFKKNN